jgi:HK97 family phage portal protein
LNPITALVRKLTSMSWGYLANRGSWTTSRYGLLQPGSTFDYQREVGDVYRNSAAYVCLAWLARNGGDDEQEEVDDHPLIALLNNPNPYMSYADLWKATVLQYSTGNAYWLKIRSAARVPVQIYPVPNWMIEPRSEDKTQLIEWYEYRPGSETYKLAPSEVIHFRNGYDPDNPLRGLSDFAYMMRELFSDNAVNTLIAATSRNMGIPGLIVSPESGETITADDVAAIRDSLWQRTTGDNAGKPLVLSGAVKVERLAWNAREMQLAELRNGPSERICAALGLNTMAVNLPSDSKTYSNYGESLKAAYHDGLMPLADAFAETLYRQLLPDLGDPATERVKFEWDSVEALAEDQNKKAERVGRLYKEYEVLTRAEARACLGFDVEEERDEVFYSEAGATIAKDIAAATAPKDKPAVEQMSGEDDPVEENDATAEVRHLDPFLARRKLRARA